jgi:hypothetical protein
MLQEETVRNDINKMNIFVMIADFKGRC